MVLVPVDTDKIDHLAQTDAVDHIADGATKNQPQREVHPPGRHRQGPQVPENPHHRDQGYSQEKRQAPGTLGKDTKSSAGVAHMGQIEVILDQHLELPKGVVTLKIDLGELIKDQHNQGDAGEYKVFSHLIPPPRPRRSASKGLDARHDHRHW